jgi:hypothetical protein
MRGAFQLVRAGMSLENVAYAVGIDPTTFFRWMREGRRATDGVLREFFTGVKKALAAFEYFCIEAIPTDTQWQRRAWLLERKFPDQWGRREPRVRPPRERPPESIEDVMREIRQILGQVGGEDGDVDGQLDRHAKLPVLRCRRLVENQPIKFQSLWGTQTRSSDREIVRCHRVSRCLGAVQ